MNARARLAAPAAGLAAGLAVAGCGVAQAPAPPVHAAPLSATAPVAVRRPQPRATPPAPPPAGPPVGTPQSVGAAGAHLTVTVRAVLDPLPGSGASLPPGARAVGVEIAIANAGPAIYDSSATGDVSLEASRRPVTPVFAPTGTCRTPLQDFDNEIGAGQWRSGCVVFAVPGRARVLAVRFSPHASRLGRVAWRVAP